MINRTNIVLSALLLGTLVASMLTDVDYSRPNIEVLPEMKYSPAWAPFERHPVFDGPLQQAPVEGTIARGEMPYAFPYASGEQEAIRAGDFPNPYQEAADRAARLPEDEPPEVESEETKQPETEQPETEQPEPEQPEPEQPETQETETQQPTARDRAIAEAQQQLQASVGRGSQLYPIYCASCHGATAAGDGPVADGKIFRSVSLAAGPAAQMKDGQLFHILTYGQKNMAAFKAELTPDQRWDLVNYLRDLQRSAAPAGLPVEDENEENEPENGDSAPDNGENAHQPGPDSENKNQGKDDAN